MGAPKCTCGTKDWQHCVDCKWKIWQVKLINAGYKRWKGHAPKPKKTALEYGVRRGAKLAFDAMEKELKKIDMYNFSSDYHVEDVGKAIERARKKVVK